MAKIARSSTVCTNINTLVMHKVTVFIQRYPGDFECPVSRSPLDTLPFDEDEQNIEYFIYIEGTFSQSGHIADDGSLEIFMPAAKHAELRILGSKYTIEPPQMLKDKCSNTGIQQRLILLGYLPAYVEEDTPQLRRAMGDFQLDYGLTVSCVMHDENMINLLDTKANPKHRRIVPVTFESISSVALDASHVHVESHCFAKAPPFPQVIFKQDNTEQVQATAQNTPERVNDSISEVPLMGCSVMVLSAGAQASLHLIRANLEPTSKLYVTTSHPELVRIMCPEKNEPQDTLLVSPSVKSPITIKGVALDSENIHSCFIEARYGAVDGPVIARLGVCTMPILPVNIQTHLVHVLDIESVNKENPNPAFDFQKIKQQTQAFWRRYGIELCFSPSYECQVRLKNRGQVQLSELSTIANAGYENNHINLYILPGLVSTLGSVPIKALAFNRQEYNGYCPDEHTPLANPALFFNAGMQNSTSENALVLAQKVGQFLGLESITMREDALKDTALLTSNIMYQNIPLSDAYLSLKTLSLTHETIFNSQQSNVRKKIENGLKGIY